MVIDVSHYALALGSEAWRGGEEREDVDAECSCVGTVVVWIGQNSVAVVVVMERRRGSHHEDVVVG